MDFNVLMQAVTTIGFPIVACGAMGWYVKYREDRHQEEMMKLTESHKIEMDSITEALTNNTIAITKLCEKLEGGVKVA